jgi:amidase
MTNEDLCYLTAKEALNHFRSGKLSPVDVLEAQIARAEQYEPTINAFTETYFEEAREQARDAEARWRDPDSARPLEGITVAVKDAQAIAGKRTTYGSLTLADNVDLVSDPMIERLVKAGAIIHARTTTPEFCLSSACDSRLWGKTVNPFNPAFGPGGSSGGSGASLAIGTTTLATGTDIGGSIRIPASCCGVVGYKPPKGRNPDGAPARMDPYNHCGPLSRSVADAALVQNVVSGAHRADHASLRDRVILDPAARDIAGMRVAYSMDLGYAPVSDEVRANTAATLDLLRGLGAVVEEVDLNWTRDVEEAALIWLRVMHFGRDVLRRYRETPELLTNYACEAARDALRLDPDAVPWAWDVQDAMFRDFSRVMQGRDVFVCPTTAIPALSSDDDVLERDLIVGGQPVHHEYGWVLTHQFNMLYNCPVLAIPSGRAASGVPTGIQVVGKTFDDATVFCVANAIEAQSEKWPRPSLGTPTSQRYQNL